MAALCGGGAWLTAGCAQTRREPASAAGQPQQPQQQQQQRPRRALENRNTAAIAEPEGRGKTDSMNGSEARGQGNGGGTGETPSPPVSFYSALEKALAGRGARAAEVCDANDAVSRRVLEEYGAMFLASSSVLPPPVCMFTSEAEVVRFQNEAGPVAATINGTRIELQAAALEALQAAREEARSTGLSITPRGGAEAARRGYNDTLRLWNSRFLPALSYWNRRGRLSDEQVARLRKAALREQVREVLELEQRGIFFSKDLSKSILYSVAAPGTSQHLSLLAFDVLQFGDARVRRILAAHGWFQTVKSDLPHFTYLGVEEKDLPVLGLRRVQVNGQTFWIPNV
ncbi:MAG TPA: hypothetical protein VGX92_05050 [Pyrinomonadaceae bacterium]|jgi:hypothetical protein|nr:hypothetical protein [Pyrinomonadaceae bacterium]